MRPLESGSAKPKHLDLPFWDAATDGAKFGGRALFSFCAGLP